MKKLILFTICCLFILFGCTNPFEQPKAEKGSFSLAVNGVRTGRTILPATVQDDFATYKLEFFAEDTTTNPVENVEQTSDKLGDPVILEVGTYDLYVTAYMDEEKEKPAAYGSLTGIVIGPGAAVTDSVTLTAVIDDGEGTFGWDITFPAEVTTASMTITPLDEETGTPEQTLSFTDGTPDVDTEDSITLNAGYYRVVFNLGNAEGHTAVHREYLHVYKNMDSLFEYDFEGIQFAIVVTNGDNDGAGSLRQAIIDVVAADGGGMIIIDPSVGTIALTARLVISKSLTIEGNGVIITPSSPSSANFQLLYISSGTDITVNISRVWFKDGRYNSNNEGPIFNAGNLSLESCIFSGNQAIGSYSGGAIYNTAGTMSVKGCTFYGNSAGQYGGGAIFNTGGLTLEGNLFYGNTATTSYPVVNNFVNGTGTSLGYNVVDVALGTGTAQSGFAAADNETDTGNVSVIPVSPVSFKVLSDSVAAGVITELSADYPAIDFYGNAITAPAASGAVQAAASGTGYTLVVSVNNSASGSVSITTVSEADGLYSGTVSITATPIGDNALLYWLVNGGRNDSGNPLSLSINEHTTVQAVFGKVIEVTDFTDSADGNGDTGTLRYALYTAQDGDTIRFPSVTAGTSVVELVRALPNITTSITIEGNGITITPSSTLTAGNTTQLLRISTGSAVVSISRVHFKNGRTTSDGVAIYNNQGNVSLESCIFTGNQNTVNPYAYGGAVYNYNGTMNVKGCTFYNNSTNSNGGAIYTGGADGTTLTLEGNLFYGNTAADRGPVVNRGSGTVTSLGYNVIDAEFGDVTVSTPLLGGFDAADNGTDKRLADLLDANTTSPFVDAAGGNFAPVSGIKVIDDALPDGYPVKDFFGNNREIPWAAGAVK